MLGVWRTTLYHNIYVLCRWYINNWIGNGIGHYWPLFLISVLVIFERCNQYCKIITIEQQLGVRGEREEERRNREGRGCRKDNYWENAHFHWKNQKPDIILVWYLYFYHDLTNQIAYNEVSKCVIKLSVFTERFDNMLLNLPVKCSRHCLKWNSSYIVVNFFIIIN